MSRIVNLFLAISVFACLLAAPLAAQEKDPLDEANQLYAAREYERAADAYQKLLAEFSDPPTRAKIIFNLGLTYKRLKQYDKAIETFNRIFAMTVNDREPGGNIMQLYRNYRPSAQWEIGNCLFAKGDYAGALAAYRATREKYPFQSGCGTCQASFEFRYVLHEAVTLEYLGRYEEAVASYLKIYHPRLVEIYEANGQLEDLKALIAAKDEPAILEKMQKYAWTREKASEYLGAWQFREFFKIYEFGKAGNITALMSAARKHRRQSNPHLGDWIAKMLARDSRVAVPLIGSELKNLQSDPQLFYRALAFVGSPAALAVLKENAEKVVNSNDAAAFVRALSLAGADGERTLKEIEEKNTGENLKIAIRMYRDGRLNENSHELKFPPPPKRKLPASLADLPAPEDKRQERR
jgi:tetratricopeptide (TPR) repeat protein